MTYPCPACRTPANLESGCPGCGRGPDLEAAEVIRLDGEIAGLRAQLRAAQVHRNDLAARVRATRVVVPPVVPPPVAPVVAAPPRPEASTLTVQNVLFILGGLLLGTAAIVFTAVAWAAYGVGGRAAILAVVTALALGAPLLALRRRLVATAETFAAVGLLLVVLDGYAAWYVNLFGLASWPGPRYAALVCAVTAVVAAGYAAATRLTGPRFGALAAAQPVLPLLAAAADVDSFGWALTFAALALVDLGAVWWARGGLRVAAWAAYGCALGAAGVCALVAMLAGAGPVPAIAGAPLVVAALALLLGALVARSGGFGAVAGAVLVVTLGSASVRLLAELWPGHLLVLMAAVAAVLAGAVWLLPPAMRIGPRVGGFVVAGTVAVFAVALASAAAASSVSRSMRAAFNEAELQLDWQVPVAVAVLAVAVAVLLPRGGRLDALVVGGLVAVLALPLPGWATSTVDVMVAAGLVLVAVRRGPARWAVAGAVLAVHAVLVGLARPASTAAVLAAVAVLGVTAAALARRRVVGGVALAVGMVAAPGAIGAALLANEVEPWWIGRATLAATALLLAALPVVRRQWTDYPRYAATAVLILALLIGTVPEAWDTGDPPGVYAAVCLLIGALALRVARAGAPDRGDGWWSLALAPLAVRALIAIGPAAWAVLAEPYAWLGRIWSGPPDGGWSVSGSAAVTLIVVAAAVGVFRPLWSVPFAAVAVPVTLAALDAPWPTVPAVSLVLGLAGVLAPELLGRAPSYAKSANKVPFLALSSAGVAGALPTEATTLTALGLVVVVSAVVGAVGRTLAARLTGWLAAAVAGVTFAVAAALAADLPLRGAGFAVLAVAAAVLAAGGALAARRPVESRALDAAAHAAAAVALLLTAGQIGYAAAVCTLWGVATGARALWRAQRRLVLAVVASGSQLVAWWLLLTARDVVVTEAYTLPAAGAALIAGWLALRARPERSSWLAYGPGLAAAFLPSLASVLVADGQAVRRLLLGAGAVAAVLAGAAWRRQAPVVLGGATLVAVALAELIRVWDLMPRWIFLAAGGFALIGLAMTYERRRRDLMRLRETVGRMG